MKESKPKQVKKSWEFADLESMLVSLWFPEVLGDLTELRKRDLLPFPDPALERGRGASLGESESENPALEVICNLRWFFCGIEIQSPRRERAIRGFWLSEDERGRRSKEVPAKLGVFEITMVKRKRWRSSRDLPTEFEEEGASRHLFWADWSGMDDGWSWCRSMNPTDPVTVSALMGLLERERERGPTMDSKGGPSISFGRFSGSSW